jgi:hypothetical protein
VKEDYGERLTTWVPCFEASELSSGLGRGKFECKISDFGDTSGSAKRATPDST